MSANPIVSQIARNGTNTRRNLQLSIFPPLILFLFDLPVTQTLRKKHDVSTEILLRLSDRPWTLLYLQDSSVVHISLLLFLLLLLDPAVATAPLIQPEVPQEIPLRPSDRPQRDFHSQEASGSADQRSWRGVRYGSVQQRQRAPRGSSPNLPPTTTLSNRFIVSFAFLIESVTDAILQTSTNIATRRSCSERNPDLSRL